MASAQPQPGHALPRNYVRPCVLLLLREQPAHGYDLVERLRPLGLGQRNTGGLYRVLRALEEEGLVHSAWELSKVGPGRRVYGITRAGMQELHSRARELAESRESLDSFLARWRDGELAPTGT